MVIYKNWVFQRHVHCNRLAPRILAMLRLNTTCGFKTHLKQHAVSGNCIFLTASVYLLC